ncbi:CASP-like protein SELMODRAFT_431320 [Selaginella moellendorffii]|uniref:CASP-like protein SELMODRAFT_431320 n=1 Tax=Selaginella moellendorffii TaxID=88036 RepID=UPI000D1CFE08|nr:CASP-like protein SELMODRAFT_431320 [Selaginella moellendorffii]XP_024522668.1 CASP-like protein SELMODRAFT_431320 [Selaginella moellendorffii]XP_024522669.1 CASP-like protein SELMODRAFT_431320 [Selaginella moellendorffii]|eukprot:XP_024522667.1 CASP-like protein SELMODRAFT_431320 [Selaginella moellendorffii]
MGVASQSSVANEAGAAPEASIQQTLRGFSSPTSLLLRIATAVLCTLTLAFLVTSKERKEIASIDIVAIWSNSKALIFLAVVSGICLGYSLLHAAVFLVMLSGNRNPLARKKALDWMVFLADQLLAYAMLSAAAASAEVAYLAKNGQVSSGWFAVCNAFSGFCNKVGVALVLSFFSVIPLAINAFISAYHLRPS